MSRSRPVPDAISLCPRNGRSVPGVGQRWRRWTPHLQNRAAARIDAIPVPTCANKRGAGFVSLCGMTTNRGVNGVVPGGESPYERPRPACRLPYTEQHPLEATVRKDGPHAYAPVLDASGLVPGTAARSHVAPVWDHGGLIVALAFAVFLPAKASLWMTGQGVRLPIEPPLIGLAIGPRAPGDDWSREPIARFSVAGMFFNALSLVLAILSIVACSTR